MVAQTSKIIVQGYPRIEDSSSKDYGFLDHNELTQHKARVPIEELPELILAAIENANRKSGRAMLNISPDASEKEIVEAYEKWDRSYLNTFINILVILRLPPFS